MGLIKAFTGAVGGALADTWLEAITPDGIDNTVIMKQGVQKSDKRSSNTKGTANVISNGSKILVPENVCMLTVDNGKITNIVTDPGQYVFESKSAPSIFTSGIANTAKDAVERFMHGGQQASEQRVVYINLQPLPGIPFGTATPMPYPDPRYNTTIDLRFYGTFEIQIKGAENAVRFYTEAAGKGAGDVTVTSLFKSEQYKSEFLMAMMQALSVLSSQGVSYNQIGMKLMELTQNVRDATEQNWQRRGFTITSVGMGPVTISDEAKELLKERLKADTMLGGDVQRAMMAGAVGRSMEAAAGNAGGAAIGFYGMNAAQSAGAGILGQFAPHPSPAATAPATVTAGWTCTCGNAGNTGKFCSQCGKQKPAPAQGAGWTCSCGQSGNTGKFCGNCGKSAPQADWTCSCGNVNSAGTKFCGNCGKQNGQ